MPVRVDITVLSGVSSGDIFHFDLEPGSPIRIGRNPDCNLMLQDPTVSRNHAKIEPRSNGLFLSDLGSSAGTVHMGFKLAKGEEGARVLHNGDEFKIGESIFRVNFDESNFGGSKAAPEKAPTEAPISLMVSPNSKRRKLMLGLGGVLAVVLLVMLLMPEKKAGLPPQKNESFNKEQLRVLGYWRGGKDKDSDQSHLDKVKFNLPGADLVIDFDSAAESKVKIGLDEGLVDTLEPDASWSPRQIIVRDILAGRGRDLVFDNLDYPRTATGKDANSTEASGGRLKQWGVRNVRWVPISHDRNESVTDAVRGARTVADGIDNSPPNLYAAILALRKALVAALAEQSLDAIVYKIELDSMYPTSQELEETLTRILNEREVDLTTQTISRHLKTLMDTSSRLEAELWRRTNARMRKAEQAAAAKNYIEAHDNLIAGRAMFPDQGDYRYFLLDKMYNNDKIVTKGVRKNPSKFRKKE